MVLEIVKSLAMGEWKTYCSVGDVLCKAVIPVGAKKIIGTTEVSLDFLLANDPHLSKGRRETQHSFQEKSFCILNSDKVYTHCPINLKFSSMHSWLLSDLIACGRCLKPNLIILE